MKLEFPGQFLKNTQIPNFMKTHPVGVKFFHADGQTDRQTNTAEQIAAFPNSVSAPNNMTKIKS